MSETDVVRWGHGLRLPPGWLIRGISVSRAYPPIGFRLENDDTAELEVTFMSEDGAEVEMVFTKGGFDPEWLYDYLELLTGSPRVVKSAKYFDHW